MARVEIATQGWGWLTDIHGNGLASQTVTLTGTVYTTSGGSTPISPIVTGSDGTIPGWIDSGTYTLAVPALGVSHQIEAVSGSTGGGSGVPAGTSGASQNLKHTRANTVVWVGDTNIDMTAYGLPTDGVSDCTPAFTTMRASEGGGICRVPRGTFQLLTNLDLTYGGYNVQGEGAFLTNIIASNNIAGSNAYTGGTTAMTMCPNTSFEKFRLIGPTSMNKSNAGSPPLRSGINMRDHCTLRDVRVENFNQGVQIDGNHQILDNCIFTNSLYNLAWAQNAAGYSTSQAASGTHGNQIITAVDLAGAGLASACIDGYSKIDSASLRGVHFGFAQRGIDAFAKGSGGQQIAIGNTSFYDCSFESVGDTYILDLGWNTANRRGMYYSFFKNMLTGPQDPAYSNIGGGLEMIKFGIVQDVHLEGRVGDSSNTAWGSVGWGTTSTACGFRFEQANGFFHTCADQLWSNAGSQGKPMYRWEGGLMDWSDVYFTILDGGYVCSVLKNGSGGTLTNENLVSGVTPTNPTGTSGVKHYDGTGAAIGRVIAGGPLTTGLMVPIAYEGRFNGPPTSDATIAIGSSLAPVSGGGVKKAAAGEQIVGTAFAAPSAGSVSASFRGPWVARF